ncbi:hypothetical protein A5821_002140 [Enterococcus sp. 7F3_DIV0205]|uniref:Mga helix-turn-helix domain-containing protein n=1 Tax=Candidatus Enterococcus palustris TaxID=1834189 RepID=A0AAQ3Y7G4_9ENTE|nr:helix-turn-helix domain-containing protein [Enterococcus sp. 7F3_DIV0205]OTN82579.1 hypothetical protein A5821_002490 [Enterococcus sp. 7F3_DIV0205]
MKRKFIKKNEEKKFELFKKILFSTKGIGIQEIIQESKDSKSTTYRYIQQLNEDLSRLFLETPIKIEQQNTIFSIVLPDSLNVSYAINTLRFSYISISPEYLIFSAIADKNHISLESLAQTINLSPSYAYRTLKILNKRLAYFRVKIAFGDLNRKENLQGTETDIRFFLFYAYWNILKGAIWPFHRSPDYFKQLPIPIKTTLAPSQLTRLRYFQNITYWRILYLQEKITIDDAFLSYLIILNEKNPTIFTLDFTTVLSHDEIRAEQVYFSFLARFFIPNIDTKETKQQTAQLLIDSNLPLTNSCTNLLKFLQKKYDLVIKDESYLFFYYHVFIALLFVHYIQVDYDPLVENEKHLSSLDGGKQTFSKMEKELDAFVTNFFKTDPFLKKIVSRGLITYMTNVLYYVIDTSRKVEPLIIFCQYSRDFYTTDQIKSSLLSTFGTQTIQFTADILNADVVISDCYEGDINNQDFFFFDNPFDSQTWAELSKFINYRIHNSSTFK